MTYETKKNIPFFYKDRKRTQRWFCSFIKIGKERKERNVLLKRTDAQPCQKRAMWANCSGRSPKMSDHERFIHIAQRKWGIVSEWVNHSFFFSELLICSFLVKKRAIRSENCSWIPSPGLKWGGRGAGRYIPGATSALTQIVHYSSSYYTIFHSVIYNSVVQC